MTECGFWCLECNDLLPEAKTGRPREFCSSKCRQRNYRKRLKGAPNAGGPIPKELMAEPRWILYRDKRPIAPGGWWSSVNDQSTWMTYRDARDAVEANYVAADGLGFVLNNDGIVCVDLDDCVVDGEPNEFAREFVSALGSTYCEFSPSGRGLHVWGYASLDKGKVLAGENLKVEVYPAGRFITMTGKVYRDGGLSSLNLSDALQLVA